MNEKDLQAEKHVDSAYELLCREPEDDGAIRKAAWHYRRAALLRADTSWQQLYTSLAEKVERLLPGKEDETFLIVNTYHNTKCKVRPLDLRLSALQITRCRRLLCRSHACWCGASFRRGAPLEITDHAERRYVASPICYDSHGRPYVQLKEVKS